MGPWPPKRRRIAEQVAAASFRRHTNMLIGARVWQEHPVQRRRASHIVCATLQRHGLCQPTDSEAPERSGAFFRLRGFTPRRAGLQFAAWRTVEGMPSF